MTQRSTVTTSDARLLELVRELAFERRQVTLKSGRVSEFYVDCRNVALHPEGIVACAQALLRRLLADGPAFAAVAGPSIGADPLVSGIAFASAGTTRPIPALLVRPIAKEHGTGRRIEGLRNVAPGTAVAVVEDVLTSGGSALATVAALRDAGLNPVRVIALVDRNEGGRAAVEAAGLFVESVFTKFDIAPDLQE